MAYFRCGQGGGTSLTIQITTSSTALYGQTITISKNGTTVGTTTFDNTGEAEYTVDESGTYTVSVTYSGTTFTDTVEVTDTFDAEINPIPNGSTVTPVNDIQIWLHCADVWDKNYTTLSEVLADTTTLLALISSQNAVDYMVRSHAWCDDVCADATAMTYIGANNYAADTLLADDNPGLVPKMTSATTPSGEVIFSTQYNTTTAAAFLAFDKDDGTAWYAAASDTISNVYIGYAFTEPVIVKMARLVIDGDRIAKGKIQAYDGASWIDKTEELTFASGVHTVFVDIANNDGFAKWRLKPTAGISALSSLGLQELNFYAKDGSWLESICNSTYFESVLNVKVPTMTSNTTPSGVASLKLLSGTASLNGTAYNVFSTGGGGYTKQGNSAFTAAVGYKFDSAVKVYKVHLEGHYNAARGIHIQPPFSIRASEDESTWDTLYSSTESSYPGSNTGGADYVVSPTKAYQYYDTTGTSRYTSDGYSYCVWWIVQFWGRVDV